MPETHKCNKEGQIDSMDTKLTQLSNVVHKSANGYSLLALTKNLAKRTTEMQKDLRQVLTFQTVVETQREMKTELRERHSRRQQWLIGLLVGTAIALIGILISVIHVHNSI